MRSPRPRFPAALGASWLAACAPALEHPPQPSSGTSSTTATPPTTAESSTDAAATPTTGESAPTSTSDAEASATTSPTTPLTTGEPPLTSTTGTTTDSSTSADTSTSTGTSTGAVAPLLHIEPATTQLEIAGGWSFPSQFTAFLDGAPVPASWSVDDPTLGRITRHGGSFSARNTAAGPVQISAEYDGQVATAELELVLVDDHPVCPPRPPLTDGELAPGAFVRVVAPEYAGTGVYHGVYLPSPSTYVRLPSWTPLSSSTRTLN